MSRIPIFSLIIFLFTPLTVFGQTTILNNTDANQAPIVIASVSIDNFQYTYDESTRKLRIDFIFTNEGQSMNGVNYSLSISSSNGAEKSYIYNKDIYLASNVNSPQTIEETIPSYIYGNVTILVQAKNSSGIPLVTRIRDNIDVKQTGDTLHLDSQSCYLTVSTSTTKYNLIQGVDIDPSEQLLLNCNVINPAKKSYTLTPSVKTYERSISGPFVEESTLSTVSVKNATSTIKISIPLPTKPQAYSSVISISNLDQTIGDVSFHYVVRGESGTVHLVQMDKKSYYANDTAKVTLLWSPRADIFPGARVSSAEQTGTLLGKLYMSQDGKPCADTTSFEPSKSLEQTLNIIVPMKTNCNGYNTRIEIKDTTTNKTIVDMSFDTPKDNTPQPINWIQYAIALGVLILCIILIIVLIKIKKKHIDSKLVLLLVMLAGSLGVAQTARAITLLVWQSGYIGSTVSSEVYGPVNTISSNLSNYPASSRYIIGTSLTVRTYTTGNYIRCGNGGFMFTYSKVTVTGPGYSSSSGGNWRNCGGMLFFGAAPTCVTDFTWTPLREGRYTITVDYLLKDVEINNGNASLSATAREVKYIDVEAVPPTLDVSFTGTGKNGGKVKISTPVTTPGYYWGNTYRQPTTRISETICSGPNSCKYRPNKGSEVTITNFVGELINPISLRCENAGDNVFHFSGLPTGGISPYTYILNGIYKSSTLISNSNVTRTIYSTPITNLTPTKPFISGTSGRYNITWDMGGAYLQVTSADGQIAKVPCGPTNSAQREVPSSPVTFNGWGGDCSGTGVCALTMSHDMSVSADFIIPTDNQSIPIDRNLSSTFGACNTHTVNLSWKALRDDLGYNIARSDGDNIVTASLPPHDGPFQQDADRYKYYSDSTVTGGITYLYEVSVQLPRNVVSASSTIQVMYPKDSDECPGSDNDPTVQLRADPTIVSVGSTSTLIWSSTNSTSCVTTGDWPNSYIGSVSTTSANIGSQGGLDTDPLNTARIYNYHIQCLKGGAKSDVANATVEATTTPIIQMTLSCTANKTSVGYLGENVTFTATVNTAQHANEYSWYLGAGGDGSQPTYIGTTSSNTINEIINYKAGDTPPLFTAVDIGPRNRSASSQCGAIPQTVVNMTCGIYADSNDIEGDLSPITTSQHSNIRWNSTDAISCINPSGNRKQTSGSMQFTPVASNGSGWYRFDLNCTNPAANNNPCTNHVDVKVIATEAQGDARLWFDSQFRGQNTAPTTAEIAKKSAVTVPVGVPVAIKSFWNSGVIASCKGAKISGPSNTAMTSWVNQSLTNAGGNNAGAAFTLRGLTVGTYILGLDCKGIPIQDPGSPSQPAPAGADSAAAVNMALNTSQAPTYSIQDFKSLNQIRLIVTKSTLREN